MRMEGRKHQERSSTWPNQNAPPRTHEKPSTQSATDITKIGCTLRVESSLVLRTLRGLHSVNRPLDYGSLFSTEQKQ